MQECRNGLKETAQVFRNTLGEYAHNPDICDMSDPRFRKATLAMENVCTLPEQAIIIQYCELGSFRELGRKLGLSHETARMQVMRIRAKILEEYNRLPDEV